MNLNYVLNKSIRKVNQKTLLIMIVLLNLIDVFCTALGLYLEVIEELNPIMLYLWERGLIFFILPKIILSLLVIWLVKYLDKRKIVLRIFFTYLFLFVLIVYLYILILHSVWLSLYVTTILIK